MNTLLDFFKKHLSPPVFQDEELTRRARIVHILYLALIGGSIVAIMGDLEKISVIIILIAGILLSIFAYRLNVRGQPEQSGSILLIILTCVVLALLLVGNGIHSIAVSVLPILIFIAALILNRRRFTHFVFLIFGMLVFVVYAEFNLPWFGIHPPTGTDVTDLLIVAIIMVIATVTSYLLVNRLIENLSRTRLADARIRALVESSPDTILEIDRTGKIVFTNRYAETYLGKNIREELPADQIEDVLKAIEKAIDSGESQADELQTIAPDGRLSWDSFRIGPVKSGDQTTSLTISMTEITAQKEVERRLRESEERYRLISSVTSDYTFSTKLDGEDNMSLNWVAGAFEEMTGYTLGEYKAHGGWLAHLYPEDVEKDDQALATLKNNQSVQHEIRTITKAKKIQWVQVYAHPVWDENTSQLVGIVGAVQDITERKQAEAALQKTASRLELLHNIDQALLSAQSPTEIARDAFTRIRQLIPSQRTSITLFDFEKNEASFLVASFDQDFNPAGQSVLTLQEYGQYIIDELLQQKACRVDDVLTDPRCNELDKILAQKGFRSWLYLPLFSQGQLIGALNFARATGNPFTAEEESIAHEIANQLAIVLKQNQLHESLQIELAERKQAEEKIRKTANQLIMLNEIDRIISEVADLNSVLEVIRQQLEKLVPSDLFSVRIFNETTNTVTYLAVYENGKYWDEPDTPLIPDSHAWRVFENGESILHLLTDAEVEHDRSVPYPHIGDRSQLTPSLIFVPLKKQGKTIGTLSVQRYQQNSYTIEHLKLVEAVAIQVAIAIENARLFDSLQAELSERKRIQDILFEEKERAEVTLYSIGDAVITTDVKAQVDYLNPVAESLTGWKLKEAIGQPVEKVFRVIKEESRSPVTDPVARCLQEDRVIDLANNSILIRRDGREFSIDDSAAPIRNRKGEIIGAVLVFHDMTKERRLSRQVAHDAMHDDLTGILNRREFEKRLGRALNSAKEHNISHVLCYLDLDQFKIVNDTAGHEAGDTLLIQIAGLLSGLFRQRDTFARLGGDEFGLLLENCTLDQALTICTTILAQTYDFPFAWEGNNFQVSVSIGIAPITAEKESVNQLLSQADIACYSAKDLGRNRYFVYQSEDSETAQRHGDIILAAHLKDAVTKDQFILYCQPIVELTLGSIGFSSYEILLRMLNHDNDLILPSAFIPSAERYGLMPAIDRWVIRRVFSTMATSALRDTLVTINLSGTSLDDETLLEYVLEQLDKFSIPTSQICFEITETAAILHILNARQFAQAFRARGGKIALDDFGSGLSSFRYLKTFPVDYIKIDGDFVSEMLANPNDQAMVEAITQVAHTLGIYVIAEHATNVETINRLRELGVEAAQGFGTGFPVPVEEAWKNQGPGG